MIIYQCFIPRKTISLIHYKEFKAPTKEQIKINAEKNKLILQLFKLLFMPLTHSKVKKVYFLKMMEN